VRDLERIGNYLIKADDSPFWSLPINYLFLIAITGFISTFCRINMTEQVSFLLDTVQRLATVFISAFFRLSPHSCIEGILVKRAVAVFCALGT